MKKFLAALLMLSMVFTLSACGGGSSTEEADSEEAESEEVASESEEVKATPLELGEKIDTDLMTMTVDSTEIVPEYQIYYTDNFYTDLEKDENYQYMLIKGHIENKGTEKISHQAFNVSVKINDEVEFTTDDTSGVELSFIRDNYLELDPYTDLDYIVYAKIPTKLVEQYEKADITIGFKNDMSALATVYEGDSDEPKSDAENFYVVEVTK